MARKRSIGKVQQQFNAIKQETDNPAILQDVADTEFGVMPESVEDIEEKHDGVREYVVRNSVDGKTWNDL